jgi:hypothetical protein
MIRLPPSSITLGLSDLKDFERRQERRKVLEAAENVQQQFAPFQVGAQDGPSFGLPRRSSTNCHEPHDQPHTLSFQVATSHRLHHVIESASHEPQSPMPPESSTRPGETDIYALIGAESSPENLMSKVQRPSSPSKDDFHYGGFMESPSRHRSPVHSSPFGTSHVTISRSKCSKWTSSRRLINASAAAAT